MSQLHSLSYVATLASIKYKEPYYRSYVIFMGYG